MKGIARTIALLLVGVSLPGLLVACSSLRSPSASSAPLVVSSSTPAPTPEPTVEFKVYPLAASTVYVLTIPPSYSVTPVLSETLETVEQVAQGAGAIAVINGGFFDPANQQTTSFVIQQGEVTADPRANSRLVDNPNLAPYLELIFNRSEFRRYQCGSTVLYDIVPRMAAFPDSCHLIDALGGGPQLLPELTLEQEGFLDRAEGVVTRDPLGYNRKNARSAIGIRADGSMVWVMVAQTEEQPTNSGMSLVELAAFMRSLGVETAMNLDGGSSSSLYYNGETVYGRVDEQGNRIERAVKSVLVITPP